MKNKICEQDPQKHVMCEQVSIFYNTDYMYQAHGKSNDLPKSNDPKSNDPKSNSI